MLIRNYQPGDEGPQARIYNEATRGLPAFKPASPDEVARRYRTIDPDPATKFYADEGGEVVGYAVLNPNGRISHPWCLPGAEAARGPLLDAALGAARRLGLPEVWAAYRADWAPVLAFLEGNGFAVSREMLNYVAECDRLPEAPPPEGLSIGPLRPEDLPRLVELGRGLFRAEGPADLGRSLRENPYFGPDDLFTARPAGGGPILGAALFVTRAGYADPTKVDPAMPCFRLGAFGTERERHKRIDGLFSCVFADRESGAALLGEAVRRARRSGLAHVAAQGPSDHPESCAFYDEYFRRQGAFPILTRRPVG